MSPRARINLILLGILLLVAVEKWHEASGKPGPVPPDPTPGPSGNIRVAFIIESSENMPQEVIDEFSSADVRLYLNDHAAKEGSQPAYRVFDKDTNVAHESAYWQKVLATPPSSLPWLVIDRNGPRRDYAGAPPKTVSELKTLLQKYGGK